LTASDKELAPQAPFIKDKNTVLLLHFDEGKGDPQDESDYKQQVVLKGGVSWIKEGKFGGALSFDGLSGYVDCGSDESLALMGPITMEAWFKPLKPDGPDRGLLGRSGGIDGGYMLLYERYNNVYASLVTADQGHHCVTSDVHFIEGQWQHLAFTYDGISVVKWYIDGKLVDTDTKSTSGKIVNIAAPFVIGMYGGDRFYKGLIDEVRVSNIVRQFPDAIQPVKNK
jgi:hypothetical protein